MFKKFNKISNLKVNFKSFDQKDILIFDSTGSKHLLKLFNNEKKIEILFARYESMNFFLMLRSLFNLNNLTFLQNYIINFIKITNPKIIITFVDNNPFFYELKNNFPGILFISIQNGLRNILFYEKIKKLSKKKNLRCDYIVTFGKSHEKIYKFIKVKEFLNFGSIKNNYIKKLSKKKKGVLFISEFSRRKDINLNEQSEDILKSVILFCKSKKIELTVLLRNEGDSEEFIFFKNISNSTNYPLKILKIKNLNEKYRACDRSSLTISSTSTLGYERIARGNKTLIIKHYRYNELHNFLYKNKNSYPLVIFKNNNKEIFMKILRIFDMNMDVYLKSFKIHNTKKIINYDKSNLILKKKIQSLINEKNILQKK